MKKLIGILLILGWLSCEESKPRIGAIEDENFTSAQIDSILMEFKFNYESPIILDSSDYVLIPISTNLLESRTKFSRDGYYSEDYPRYWNVLFYNRKTGETRLLTENKVRISSLHTKKGEGVDSKIMQQKILYQIGDIDYNQDGKLNGRDPEYLFSSEFNGENLTRISPKNEDLQYFNLIPHSNQLLIRTLRDVNQDSIFNKEDESILYKAEWVAHTWKLNEIIDSIGRKKIENLYFEQWLKKQGK